MTVITTQHVTMTSRDLPRIQLGRATGANCGTAETKAIRFRLAGPVMRSED